jgi:uncharacterized membrane protein
MTNIVTKLRNLAIQELKADRRAAMTENHDLWREVERLRAALSEIVEECRNTGYGDPTVMERMIDRIEEIASAALGEKVSDAAARAVRETIILTEKEKRSFEMSRELAEIYNRVMLEMKLSNSKKEKTDD